MANKTKWIVKNKDTVYFQLNSDHKFYIEKTEEGFLLKVYYEKNDEKTILYRSEITDSQLGFIK